MNIFNEIDNRNFYLNCLRNIVKNEDGEYELQKVYELVDGKIVPTEESENNSNHNEYTKNAACAFIMM